MLHTTETDTSPPPGIYNWRADLSREAGRAIEACQIRRSYTTGQYVFRVGDPASSSFQVRSGRLSVSSLSLEGRQMLLSTNGPGDCLGEVGLVCGNTRLNDLSAMCETEVDILRRSDFLRVSETFPEIQAAVSRALAIRFQFLFSLIQDANLLPLYDRLGRSIVRLCLERARSAKSQQGPIRLDNISQEVLAEMVGATRQSVGRELKKMVEGGLLKIEYRGLIVLNLGRMSEEFGRSLAFEPMTEDRLRHLTA